jgi:hypothetical protein
MIGMPSLVRSTKNRWMALMRSACARAAFGPLLGASVGALCSAAFADSLVSEIWSPNTPLE